MPAVTITSVACDEDPEFGRTRGMGCGFVGCSASPLLAAAQKRPRASVNTAGVTANAGAVAVERGWSLLGGLLPFWLSKSGFPPNLPAAARTVRVCSSLTI